MVYVESTHHNLFEGHICDYVVCKVDFLRHNIAMAEAEKEEVVREAQRKPKRTKVNGDTIGGRVKRKKEVLWNRKVDHVNKVIIPSPCDEYPLDRRQVHWVLGLPYGPKVVVSVNADMSKSMTLRRRLALSDVLYPTTCLRLEKELIPMLSIAYNVVEYDWCQLVLDKLLWNCRKFAQKFYKDGFLKGVCGCTYFPVVCMVARHLLQGLGMGDGQQCVLERDVNVEEKRGQRKGKQDMRKGPVDGHTNSEMHDVDLSVIVAIGFGADDVVDSIVITSKLMVKGGVVESQSDMVGAAHECDGGGKVVRSRPRRGIKPSVKVLDKAFDVVVVARHNPKQKASLMNYICTAGAIIKDEASLKEHDRTHDGLIREDVVMIKVGQIMQRLLTATLLQQ
ncbi:Gag-Pro-Pol polyprotein [Bienertia sinuspersici]